MKKVINNIISFGVMCFLSFIIVFVSYQFNIRRSIILRRLENIDYYEKTYQNINTKIENFIINDEIKKDYKTFISKEIISNDIKRIVSGMYGKNVNISRYDDFYNIIKKYSSDKDICSAYSKNINNIYVNNLFPKAEMNIITKLYLGNESFTFITICLSTLCLIFVLTLFLINRNFKYFIPSLVGSFVICVVPQLFITFGFFNNFIYTNKYYTDFLYSMLRGIANCMLVASFIILTILIIYYVKFKHLKVNK